LAKGQRRARADGLRIGDSEREARALPLDVFGPRGELALVREHEGSLDPQLRHEEGYIEDAAPTHFGVGAAADGQRARKEVPQHDALARGLALHPTLDRRHGEDGPDQLLGATPGPRDFRHGAGRRWHRQRSSPSAASGRGPFGCRCGGRWGLAAAPSLPRRWCSWTWRRKRAFRGGPTSSPIRSWEHARSGSSWPGLRTWSAG